MRFRPLIDDHDALEPGVKRARRRFEGIAVAPLDPRANRTGRLHAKR